jgi:peptidoglycan/LPS O-acetylase OafA/YrhL
MFSETRYRRDIQVLRGLAVLAVVLFHAKESYFPLGYLGVDVFFVISGFVVTPLILRIFSDQTNREGRLSNLRYFYSRRFYRLAPALAVTLAISAILIFLLGPIADHQRFARQGIATLLLAGNLGAYRYSGDYFSPNPNPLVHTWSLSVEEQIYVFLPLVLMLILRNRRSFNKITAVIFGFTLVISFISFLSPGILQPLYSEVGIRLASQFSFYSPIDRVWQFALGGLGFLLLAQYQGHIKNFSKNTNLVLAIAIVIILFGPIHMSPRASSILASLFTIVVILFRSLEMLPNVLTQKLEWIGDRSYSIYLVHMPLLYIAKYSPVTQIGSDENRLIQGTIGVIASILLGALSFSKIENRFRNSRVSKTISVKAISSSLVLTLITPLVIFIVMDIGVKNRYWGLDRNIPQPSYASALDSKCLRDSELGPPCIYPTKGAIKQVLLIGDSHAGHISQAVIDAAKSMNWTAVVWVHSGCHVQFQRTFPLQVSGSCIDINKQMYKWVEKNKPTAIIVSQFVQSDSNQRDLRDALTTLRSLIPNVLLIENSPVFPDEKDFMVSRPLVMSPYKPPTNFSQSMMQVKDKNASNQLANWADNNKISTMNFDSIFCNKGICTRWSDAGWLFRDDDHFSVAGAELTIPKLIAFLEDFS